MTVVEQFTLVEPVETKMVELSELMATKVGSVNPKSFLDETFELFSIPAFDLGSAEVTSGREIGSSKQNVRPGDVLLSKIVPHIRRSWIVTPEQGFRQIASGEWIIFRDSRIHGPYLRQVLVSDNFNAQFMQTVAGVGGSLLRARPAHVAKIRIPLPPLPEQRRIAAILDKADLLRTQRREALAHLDALTKSIFHSMFGGEKTVGLGSVATFRYGSSNKSAPTGTICLRIPNVARGAIDWDDLKRVPVTAAELDRLKLEVDDILFVRSNGNPDFVGRSAVFTVQRDEPIIYASYLIRARLEGNLLTSTYVHAFLETKLGRRHLRSGARTSAGQFNINTQALSALQIPVPPLELQQTFARRVAAVERLKVHHRSQLAELDTLFGSLQHRAFKGEL